MEIFGSGYDMGRRWSEKGGEFGEDEVNGEGCNGYSGYFFGKLGC